MLRTLRSIKDTLRVNRGGILIFEILYRLFSAFVLIEAMSRGVSFALKQSGFSYLTAENALRFLCLPVTLLVLAGFFLLFLFFANLEICTLYTAFQAGVAGERLSPVKMLFFGMKNMIELFQTGNVRVLFLNINYYLLTEGWILIGLIRHIRPLSYVVTGAFGLLPVKIIMGILTVVMTGAAVFHLFVPVIATLRDISYRDTCQAARGLLRKRRVKILLLLAASNGFVWLFYYVSQFLLKVIAAFLIVLFAARSMELALILTVSNGIDIAAFWVSSVMGVYLNMGIHTALLYRYQDEKYHWEIPPYHYYMAERGRRLLTVALAVCLVTAGGLYAYDSIYTGAVRASTVISEAKITSHRGNSSEAPENTLPAIEAAIDNMSDYVEIDVQETKDDVVVVYHDASLKRITGEKGRLWEYTYGDLLLMDFGGWFSEEFMGTSIPTLAEALDTCKGRINMNIELKADHYSDTLVEQTLQLIEEHDMEAQVVISSTSYRYLKQVKEINPDMETGYILTAAYGNYFEDENIDFFSIRSGFITGRLVESAHDCGKKVHAWTVNTKGELNRMKRLQVDNIITDMPVLAREILYREADTENMLEFIKLALRIEK